MPQKQTDSWGGRRQGWRLQVAVVPVRGWQGPTDRGSNQGRQGQAYVQGRAYLGRTKWGMQGQGRAKEMKQ